MYVCTQPTKCDLVPRTLEYNMPEPANGEDISRYCMYRQNV